jgi:hypothetical protein
MIYEANTQRNPSMFKDAIRFLKQLEFTIPHRFKINTRQDGEVDFTTKIDVEYQQGVSKGISFDLNQLDKYVKGNYAIVVYQNGFKIGEGIATLK